MFSFTFSGRAASGIGQKRYFFKKRALKIFLSLFNPFLSILHQNKALHKFYKRGQRPIAVHIKCLD